MRGESIVGILFLFRLSFDVTLCIFGIGQTVCLFVFLYFFLSYLCMPVKGGLRGRVNVGESWGTGWRVRVLAGGEWSVEYCSSVSATYAALDGLVRFHTFLLSCTLCRPP